jgi:hypothetical protein
MELDGRRRRLTGERPVVRDDIGVVDIVAPVGRLREPQ